MNSVRLDKFLWAVRLFKTRPDATDACRLGRVEMGGKPVKAGRDVLSGDCITVTCDDLVKTIRVHVLLDKRVAGKLVADYMEDLTPPEEYEKARKRREEHALNLAASPVLRPGKRDRRLMQAFLNDVKRSADPTPEGED